MGTNYYVQTEPCPTACDHCSASERIHLGKSSIGWRFSFQAQPGWGPLNAFTEWIKLAMTGVITDEHEKTHTLGHLLELIHSQRELRSHAEPNLNDGWFISDGHEFRTRYFS